MTSRKSTASSLEWTFLEVEEDEWQQRTGTLDTAAAANGFPVSVPPQQSRPSIAGSAPAAGVSPAHRHPRRTTFLCAGVLLLVVVVGYRVWYSVQHGVEKLQQDIGNIVKLDAAKARAAQPELSEQAAVEAVEFLNGKAMAQVVITRTGSANQQLVQHQTHFYEQTAQGWVRTQPVADFWGPPHTLATPNLHFVFRSRDRAAVERLAPGAEALYVALRHATGQTLVPAGERLMIEVVPEQVRAHATLVDGSIRLPSPALFNLFLDYTAEELLASLTRSTLAGQMLTIQVDHTAVRPQWRPMVAALSIWLTDSDVLPLAPRPHQRTYAVRASLDSSVPLASLLDCNPCAGRMSRLRSDSDVPHYAQPHLHNQLRASTLSLIDFVVATYGLDVLPALVQGFNQYEDWTTLVPAVFDVSVAELELAWHRKLESNAQFTASPAVPSHPTGQLSQNPP